MLETYFGPCSGLVWSSLMTISGRAARSAALYGDGFGADFRPSDVDYESLPSLIKRFEGATRSGSMRSIQWCIVIHLIHSGSWSNSRVSEFLRFHLIPVSRGASRFHARSPPGRAFGDVLADLDRARPVFHDSVRTANYLSNRPMRVLATRRRLDGRCAIFVLRTSLIC